MNLTTYSNVDQFLDKAQAYLEQAEVTNNLILGLTLGLQNRSRIYDGEPLLLTIEDGQAVQLVAVMTPPRNLLIYTHQPSPEPLLEALAQYLASSAWIVTGVMASPKFTETFAQQYATAKLLKYKRAMQQRIYQLTQVQLPPDVPGQMRLATVDDLDWVVDWVQLFSQEALGRSNAEEDYALTKRFIQDQKLYLWVDGEPVSIAAKSRATNNACCISLVFTPPRFRRQGYASACVAHLSQAILDEGYRYSCLFTDLANPTSNAIYQQIGYQPTCDFAIYQFA